MTTPKRVVHSLFWSTAAFLVAAVVVFLAYPHHGGYDRFMQGFGYAMGLGFLATLSAATLLIATLRWWQSIGSGERWMGVLPLPALLSIPVLLELVPLLG